MKIGLLKMKNFKAFKDTKIRDIPRFYVIVGRNGSAKTTLFNIFSFLKDALSTDVNIVFNKLGSFNEVISRGCTGNIKFRAKNTYKNNPVVTYFLSISQKDGKAVIDKKNLKYRRCRKGQPWEFLNFNNGQGSAVINKQILDSTEEKDLQHEDQSLKSSDILAIKGLAQFKRFPAIIALSELIDNWHVSNIHVNEAHNIQQAYYAEHLSTLSGSLSKIIDYLYSNHKEKLNEIIEVLQQRIKGIPKAIACHLKLDNSNTSASFSALFSGIQKLCPI